jgi:AraC family ethanolamine operon transcriptional activator
MALGFEAPAPRRPRGCTLARRAAAWLRLRAHLSNPPTIADLCAALPADARRVHEAFRAHIGTTPKAYLKTLRLHAVRRDLLSARHGVHITDVALEWGFGHFGWFSQDYRRLFGETPSQTLRRVRAGVETGTGLCSNVPASRRPSTTEQRDPTISDRWRHL